LPGVFVGSEAVRRCVRLGRGRRRGVFG